MTDEEKSKLSQIKQLTDDMLVLVSESTSNPIVDTNLENFESLEKDRQDLIKDFFSHPVAEDDSKEVADVIQQILQTTDQITKVLEQNKKQLAKEFNHFKLSKKVTSAYLSNST
ncbi:MAG: flagellar protein FliT [Pseudomonadota bacterium]